MKKLIAMILAGAMVLSVAACGTSPSGSQGDQANDSKEDVSAPAENAGDTGSDLEYVKGKGTLVVGITDFAPMDYKDDNGEWVGFDADMARAFAESIGVEVEFTEIDWNNKIMELDGKNVDCLWNGMTIREDEKDAMDCSIPYCNNSQVVIAPVDKADQYKDADSLKGLNIAVEDGSAGADAAADLGLSTTPVQAQADALMEVKAGSSDVAIIDYQMAVAMVGEGTSYPDLTYTVELTNEQYGVGFRKGSDLVQAVNDFFAASYKDGSMKECADKYSVVILEQK